MEVNAIISSIGATLKIATLRPFDALWKVSCPSSPHDHMVKVEIEVYSDNLHVGKADGSHQPYHLWT